MPRITLRFLLLPLLGLVLAGCVSSPERVLPPPHEGNVRDVPAFRAFIETYEPSPEDFKRVYPDIVLVLPGDIATKELRMNNSRFFATLNDDKRIIDGRFQ